MKIEIRLNKIGNAGMYELVNMTNDISDNIILKISDYQPYYHARLEAEKLAVVLNCDLIEDGKIIRETVNEEGTQ